ncbi:trichohyalin [Pimephales promelas]|uniref:trichohyalin n=1 Tax=Pimephales promelas TaxID=90988 RepID=UPI0019558DF8|nr:trichohyalin [Pimephales promelas]KAG1959242.1 GTPase IMAP family member 8-like [Pimephales promelas]
MEEQKEDPSFLDRRPQTVEANGGSLSHQPSPLPELRVVLLGRKGAGKSSAGNTILSLAGGFETNKPTEECVKRRADVEGRRVTVVDTPGWEWYYPGNGTPGWVRRETKRSMSLCPPGPHAVLLVVRSCTSVTADYHQQIEEHLELLGKAVWDHTLVLFTRGDELGSIPIEQRIRNGGKAFQRLLERCGNRFHVLENKRRLDDGSQVKELMRKLDELVGERGGRYYEMDVLLLELEAESKRRARERRKKQRLMEAQTHRGTIRAVLTNDNTQTEDMDERNLFSRGSRRLPELRLVLLGERETGKSSAGNAILGGPGHFQSGEATEECSRQQMEVSNRLVTVVDVPGWEGGPEGTTPERVKREIGMSVMLCPPGPHAFLLTLRVDAFVQAQPVREHMELLGEAVWRHTLLLFTRGDQLREGVTIEQHIQGGGKELRWLVERCSNRFHVISSNSNLEPRNSKTQITELLEKIEKMAAVNRCEAFSPLVHEIQELGRQKNEKIQLKVKEFSEKLQRQDEELKKMKEREVKSIRWFFERRKKDKVQSPGKAEREETPYKGEDDRRSVMGELEERMAWLTEDKEREIHDLNAEISKLMVTHHQGLKEKEQLLMRSEEREREGEELKEKVDELQIKLLEQERLAAVKEQERKEREAEIQRAHLDEKNELQNKLLDAEKETDRMRGKAEESQKEMDSLQRRCEEEARQKESKLKEKDNEIENILREIEEVKLKAESREREQGEIFREKVEKREKEMRGVIEMMTKEMEQLRMSNREQAKTTEAEREMHGDLMEKYNTLIDKLEGKDKEIERTMREKEREQNRNAETREKLRQKEDEIVELRQRDHEKDRELKTLKQNISEKQRDTEKLKETIQANTDKHTAERKVWEEELKAKEDEIDKLKQRNLENEKCVDKLKQNISEKQNDIDKLKARIEEHAAQLKHQQGEFKVKEEENEKLRQRVQGKEEEIDTLRQSISEKQKDIEKLRDCIESHAEESAARLKHLEEELRIKEEEITQLKQRDEEKHKEIHTLKKNIIGQQQEAERLKDIIQSNIDESAVQMKRLDDEFKIKDEEIIQLRTRDLEKDREMNTLRENIHEKQKDIEKLRESIQAHIEESAAHLKHLEEELQTKREEITKLNQRDMEKDKLLQTINEKHVRDIEKLKSSIQANTEQGAVQLKLLEEELDVKMEVYKRKNTVMEKEMENIKKQFEEAKLKIQMKENIISQLQQQQADTERRSEELKQQKMRNDALQNVNAELEKEFEELKLKCEGLQTSAESYEIQMNGLEQQLDELKRLLEEKESDMRDMKVYYEERHKEHETEVEQELCRREREVERKEEKLAQNKQDLLTREGEVNRREQALTDEKQDLEVQMYRIREEEKNLENEAQNNQRLAVDLMRMREEIEKRAEGLMVQEEKLKEQEQQMKRRKDELQATERMLESKEMEIKDLTEKQEKDMENRREQLERREEELFEMEEKFVKEQHRLKGEEQALEMLRANLETRESELHKREQMWDVKTRELLKRSEELENNKHNAEKRQAELSNEESNIRQKIKGLQEKEQELDLKGQRLMEQWDSTRREHDLELESIREALGKRERELIKGEEELSQREQKLKSEEIYFEKREQVMQKREEQHGDLLRGLKKQQDVLKDRERSLDTRETDLRQLEMQLAAKDDENKFLQNQESDFEAKTQMLELLKTTLDAREKELEERQNQLDSRTQEVNNERDKLERKREELDKWEKYLYNTELKLIHKEPSTWANSAEMNGKQMEGEDIHLMHQDIVDDGGICNAKNTRSEERLVLATMKCVNNRSVKNQRVKRTLQAKQIQEDGEIDNSEGESEEDFFESSSTIGCSPWPVSDLRLMIIGDSWSSRHPARCTLVGPDANECNPWRGEISGRQVTIVEPQGLKWRSGIDNKGTFQKHLSQSVSLCQPGPHAFILVIPAYVSFTGQYRRAVERTVSALGETSWRHTIVLLTWGETLGESGPQHVKRYGDLERLVRRCGNRCHVLDNRYRESHVVKLLEKVEEMLGGNNGCCYKLD